MTLKKYKKTTTVKEKIESQDLSLSFNFDVLLKILGYIVCYANYERSVILLINKIFNSINENIYNSNDELRFLYKSIQISSYLVGIKKIENAQIIISKITDSLKLNQEEAVLLNQLLDEADNSVSSDNFNEYELSFLIDNLKLKANHIHLYQTIPVLEELIGSFRSDDFESDDDYKNALAEYQSILEQSLREIKSASNLKEGRNDFCLNADSFKSSIRHTLEVKNATSANIPTGMKGHNDQLGGNGWEGGRVYVYVGKSGNGKSMLLLNGLKWFMNYSKTIEPYNTRLVPCALYLTLENDIPETNERQFEIFIPNADRQDREFKSLTEDEILNLYFKNGYIRDNMTVHVKYRRGMSMNTNDIERLVEELAEDGFEVRLLIIDYLKRFRPVNHTGDLRLDLGENVNELSILSKQNHFPIVTAMQMNGDGMKAIEEAAAKNSNNIIAGLKNTSGIVGESKLIIENADFVFLMYNEASTKAKRAFLQLRKIKGRGKETKTSRPYIAYPYLTDGDSAMIDEDYGTSEFKGVENTGGDLSEFDPNDSNGNNNNSDQKGHSNRELPKMKRNTNNPSSNTRISTGTVTEGNTTLHNLFNDVVNEFDPEF